jgi:hypothetical protein
MSISRADLSDLPLDAATAEETDRTSFAFISLTNKVFKATRLILLSEARR